jgi:hypothetical protein
MLSSEIRHAQEDCDMLVSTIVYSFVFRKASSSYNILA